MKVLYDHEGNLGIRLDGRVPEGSRILITSATEKGAKVIDLLTRRMLKKHRKNAEGGDNTNSLPKKEPEPPGGQQRPLLTLETRNNCCGSSHIACWTRQPSKNPASYQNPLFRGSSNLQPQKGK